MKHIRTKIITIALTITILLLILQSLSLPYQHYANYSLKLTVQVLIWVVVLIPYYFYFRHHRWAKNVLIVFHALFVLTGIFAVIYVKEWANIYLPTLLALWLLFSAINTVLLSYHGNKDWQ